MNKYIDFIQRDDRRSINYSLDIHAKLEVHEARSRHLEGDGY
jgi:hypothetical protein